MDARVWSLVAAGLLIGQVTYGRFRLLPRSSGPTRDRPLTIVIPARDEALSLPLLLSDLARHRPDDCRVIVVDDHSTDDTAALAAAHAFVRLIPAPGLPPGWTGKSWACHTGVTALDGAGDTETLLFLDADVRISAGAIDAVVAQVAGTGGLVSVQPHHVVARPSERASALFGVVAVMGSRAGHRRPAGAYGPVLATTVGDYRLVGGHAAVADQVVEDLALARRYRTAGLGVSVHAGGDLIRYRMYPAGFGSLIEGWSKNIATGAGSTPLASLLGVVVWITTMCSITLALAGVGPLGGAPVAAIAAAGALTVTQLVVMFRRVGAFAWGTAVAFPLLVVCFVGVFARSLYLGTLRGSVRWRGRDIPVRRSLHVSPP